MIVSFAQMKVKAVRSQLKASSIIRSRTSDIAGYIMRKQHSISTTVEMVISAQHQIEENPKYPPLSSL